MRWKSKFDIKYTLKKLRYVPVFDLPHYFIKFFEARLFKIFNKEGRLSFWGPRFHNMDSLHTKYNLEEICALQWQRCFELSVDAFSKISNDRVYKLSYESFVLNPEKELLKIVDFVKLKLTNQTSEAWLITFRQKISQRDAIALLRMRKTQ